jgi:hypothetical protein
LTSHCHCYLHAVKGTRQSKEKEERDKAQRTKSTAKDKHKISLEGPCIISVIEIQLHSYAPTFPKRKPNDADACVPLAFEDVQLSFDDELQVLVQVHQR